MTVATIFRPRFSFAIKMAAAAALVALADYLFYLHEPGWTLGLFGLAWAAMLLAALPRLRRDRAALVALMLAAAYAMMLIDDPNPLAWVLFWTAISLAALLPRAAFCDALDWGGRLLLHAVFGLLTPLRDIARIERAWRRRGSCDFRSAAALLWLPVIGGLIFFTLFAVANPVIGRAIESIRIPDFWSTALRTAFWLLVLLAVWPSLRPHWVAAGTRRRIDAPATIGTGVPTATLALSLIVFNLVFAVQNALDIAFLWSGAPLPAGVTLAEYAHRGAYTLIATAILAGLFVLVALRPGSEGVRSPLVRRLVALWTLQNLLLVASSALRLVDYVAVYSLTVLRIAALMWMALVATGLVLICWRLIFERSARWLINANALAAAIILSLAAVLDLGAIAAAWNVRHAREIDGTGARIDLCYLNMLGDSALLPLIELEQRELPASLRDRIAYIRSIHLGRLAAAQSDWRQWSWRGARRLAAAQAALGPQPLRPRHAPFGRSCDGSHTPPPPPPVFPVPPMPTPPAPAPSPGVPH